MSNESVTRRWETVETDGKGKAVMDNVAICFPYAESLIQDKDRVQTAKDITREV